MQRSMNKYTKHYEGTGQKISEQKIYQYSWQWKCVNGIRSISNINNTLSVKGHPVKQLNHDEATRSLGVWFQPNLLWNTQFQKMREKMVVSIKKLMNTSIKPQLVHYYFHLYMTKTVFFGCGVVQLSTLEELELK